MIAITVLDPKVARYKRALLTAANTFARTLQIEKRHIDLFIVGNKLMPKNVLSYPADPKFPRPDLHEPWLGEIYINPIYIKEHDENLVYMLAHGMLHLLGYDHIRSRDRMKMERKEKELLKAVGSR
jgi:probable rRNA maturation factor